VTKFVFNDALVSALAFLTAVWADSMPACSSSSVSVPLLNCSFRVDRVVMLVLSCVGGATVVGVVASLDDDDLLTYSRGYFFDHYFVLSLFVFY
jgi:hypothetical protein